MGLMTPVPVLLAGYLLKSTSPTLFIPQHFRLVEADLGFCNKLSLTTPLPLGIFCQ